MQNIFLFNKNIFIVILYINLNIVKCLYDMQYPKSFRLNNGNIIIVGNLGIYVYDQTGIISLHNNTISQNKITSSDNQCFTTFAQFEKGEKYAIILVMHIIYILNSDGIKLFEYKLTHEINSEMGYYSIVPIIDQNNNYNIILGLLGKNSFNKPVLQYFSINFQGESLTLIDEYLFDSDDASRQNVRYDKGINCQIMNHNIRGNILTCFYHNYNNPQEVGSFSYKFVNNKIERIPMLNATYNDQPFCMRSLVSPNRKKSLLCYIRNSGDYNERTGYCSIYDIDENKFEKYNKYLSKICETTNKHLNLDYFKETKEYIFTCISAQDAVINFIRFDENFNIIKYDDNNNDSKILVNSTCQTISCYSITFSSNEYKIIGQYSCNGQNNINLFSLSEDYKPINIYSDSPEDEGSEEESDESPSSSTISQDSFNSESSIPTHNTFNSESSIPTHNTFNSQSSIPNTFNSQSSIPTQNTYNPENSENSSHSQETSAYSHDNSFYSSSIVTNNNHLSTNELHSESTYNCQLYKNSEGTICSETIPDGYYIFDSKNKILEKCHISCKTCERGPDNNSNNCLSCNQKFELNSNNNCLYKYNYYYDHTIEEIIYLLQNQLCPEKLPYEIIKTKECVETCTNEEFITKICKINYFSENNIDLITNKLRSIINETTNSNYDVIVDGNNIIYEITSTTANNEHNNISSINFGECETILKKHYSLDYLLVFKMDIKLNDSYPTFVDYEVYSPETKKKLDLSLCANTQIEVYVPINLNNSTNNLYKSMDQYGFDILDKDNSFYNDICTPFTSNDGTDMVLSDRQTNYFNENITLCENNCVYKFYNSTSGKAKCECPIKNEVTDIKTISYEKMDINTFFDIKSFSNIELIKCFKLTFSKNGLLKNYGCFIIISMTTIFIFLIIFYNINQKQLISRIIRLALKVYSIDNPPRRKSLSIHYSAKIIHDPKDFNKHKDQSNHNHSKQQQSQTIRNLIEPNISNDQKRKSSKKLTLQIRNYKNINLIRNDNYIINSNDKKRSNKEQNIRHFSRKTISKKSDADEISVYPIKQKNYNKITEKEEEKKNIQHKYIDLELNNLEYKEAIKVDKRTYLQYYCSLIKNKHIILCIFFTSSDYNLTPIKIGLFIFSFCLYFTVSALFFTDKTMHKIYEDKGIFNIIAQLPQIFYSTLISAFLNMLIKRLALSGKSIIALRKEKNKEKALKNSVELYRCLMIKFNLYFFISFLFILFFWYYVSTFCAVYKNTQIILIENTLSSFFLTLIYPFVLNLLPGIFRIPALKAVKKDKAGLYKIGNIIALI